MKEGFIKTACAAIPVTVGDPQANLAEIKKSVQKAEEFGVQLLVFPELCLTGYSCGDLFLQDQLIEKTMRALEELCLYSADYGVVITVGLPVRYQNRLFNCAAILAGGKLLGLVPKTYLPSHGESNELRYFTPGSELKTAERITVNNREVSFGTNLIFKHEELEQYCFGVEIGHDLWAPVPPSTQACEAGALIILNPSASCEIIGRTDYRRRLVSATSARLICGYASCSAAPSESTQDLVFSGHRIIAEKGTLLAEKTLGEENELAVTELDVQKLASERIKNALHGRRQVHFEIISFEQRVQETELTRIISRNPFIPDDPAEKDRRAAAILDLQAYGLKKRIEHTKASRLVLGISGGLDSTLALLVCVRAMELSAKSNDAILAVTMPCFGTTSRTKNNAVTLCEALGVPVKEINISETVLSHFKDIGQDPANTDVTFENAQARERTQVLMDVANQCNGLVIGTGDLSETALGWATYNGDHMSMYDVNASVPKTLIRHIVRYVASRSGEPLKNTLTDILSTPVSPELLPADQNGAMTQKTEDIVGPYDLHDFYLYYFVRYGFSPLKILRLAKEAFKDQYTEETLRHWLKVFLRRFFTQQFKRSCTPDAPKIGSVSLSPRGDWVMPTDASFAQWIKDLE